MLSTEAAAAVLPLMVEASTVSGIAERLEDQYLDGRERVVGQTVDSIVRYSE